MYYFPIGGLRRLEKAILYLCIYAQYFRSSQRTPQTWPDLEIRIQMSRISETSEERLMRENDGNCDWIG